MGTRIPSGSPQSILLLFFPIPDLMRDRVVLSCSHMRVHLSFCHLSQAEMNMYKDVCYYMLFALAAYGWPMYLMRKPACGLCHLASSCP